MAHAIWEANEQIEEATERGELKKDAEVLRLGVWHHAVAGSEMLQDTNFIGHLQNNGVKICLHGDVHELRRDLIGYWHSTVRKRMSWEQGASVLLLRDALNLYHDCITC